MSRSTPTPVTQAPCADVYAYNTHGNSGYRIRRFGGGGQIVTVPLQQLMMRCWRTPGTISSYRRHHAWSDNTTLARIEDKIPTIRSQSGNRDAVVLQGISSSTEFVLLARSDVTTRISPCGVYRHWSSQRGPGVLHGEELPDVDAGEAHRPPPGSSGPRPDYGLVAPRGLPTTTGKRSDRGDRRDEVRGWAATRSSTTSSTLPRNVAWLLRQRRRGHGDENCYFEDCQVSMSFGGGGSPISLHRYEAPCEHYRGILRNNIIHYGSDVGVYMNKAADFKIYNNTLWTANGFSSIDVRFAESYGSIVNNICSDGYQLRDGGLATFATNLFNASPSLFVDQANANYHLASTATWAINQHDTTADVAYDMDWESRPSGFAGYRRHEYRTGTPHLTCSPTPGRQHARVGFAAPSLCIGCCRVGEISNPVWFYLKEPVEVVP
jgi:hypothetical protein